MINSNISLADGELELAGGELEGGDRKRSYKGGMYKENHCSPSKDRRNDSCLDKELIRIVAKAINKMRNKNTKLQKINLQNPTEEIYEEVCKNIEDISSCSSEACWMTIQKLMNALGSDKDKFKDRFKPLMPKKWVKDYNEWLNTYEIEDCLKQYMNVNKDFYFYGAVPIDFKKCSVSKLCSFNLKDHIKKDHKRIGIVFNTDPSNKDGQHWISMYIDIHGNNLRNNPGIYYFDSFGHNPPNEIKELIDKIKMQGLKCNKDFSYLYNDQRYQKYNSQCGMFAIHFIKQMLDGISFESYLRLPLSDKIMKDLRTDYFIKL